MWRYIVNFFKAINTGLNAIEEYFDYRIKTGQWVGDVKDLSQDTNKNSNTTLHKLRRGRIIRIFFLSLLHVWNKLVRIAVIEKAAEITIDSVIILRQSFVQTFVFLQISFLSIIILFNLFINAPVIFFISFFPVLLFNSLLLSALYYLIQDEKKRTKPTIKNAFQVSFQVFSKHSTLILIHVVTSLVLIAAFTIVATFYSYLFTIIRLSWEDSFGYWVLIIPIFFILLASLFALHIITCQAYFIILFEGKSIFYSIKKSMSMLKEYLSWFSFFYLLLSLIFVHISYWISVIFFPLGFIASIFLFGQALFLLSFLLRRRFAHSHIVPSENTSTDDKMLLTFFMIFGLATYVATAVLTVKEHLFIINSINQLQREFIVSQQLKTYTNSKYGFSIDYPQVWTVHEENDNSITIYNNSTQTTIGGVFMNIKALPYSEFDFSKLYNARSGLSAYETLQKDITIKINNLVIDYKYPAVRYTHLKSGEPLNEYSINYLIHKDDLMYEVSFVTYDKEIQGENINLFETMIDSLKFTN
jgi:hypothetical protein